jgi:hypothetical protein
MAESIVKERIESLGGGGVDDASWTNFMKATALQNSAKSFLGSLAR